MVSSPAAPFEDCPTALPAGTRLGDFEVRGRLGAGGFGIVYLAFDHTLQREVAIKEFVPDTLVRREGEALVPRNAEAATDFVQGLRAFVNEARMLAAFDHPSLLKVHRFWEANGTAYMVMPVLRGRTLREVRQALVSPPGEAFLRGLLEPLLGALDLLHAQQVFHRDISPDNVVVGADGRPVLLDFGAARRILPDRTYTVTAVLKPSYAPIEQYAETAHVRQGPWTDLYALGATMYYLLTGRAPPPATTRAVHDDAEALTPQRCPGCSAGFLELLAWMMTPRPADRPASVAAVQERLAQLGRAAPDAAPPAPWEATEPLPGPAARPPAPTAAPELALELPLEPPPPAVADAGFEPVQRTQMHPPREERRGFAIVLGVLAAGAAGVTLWRWRGQPQPMAVAPPPPAPAASAAAELPPPPMPQRSESEITPVYVPGARPASAAGKAP